MAIITFILSILLIGFGGYALYSGFDIVTTERGLALTLCGTMALSIGFVVLALGFVLIVLKNIATNLIVQTEAEQGDFGLSDITPNVALSNNFVPSKSDPSLALEENLSAQKIIDPQTEVLPTIPISSIPSSTLSATSPSPASRFAPISSSYKTVGAIAAGAGVIAAGTGLASPRSAEQDLVEQELLSQEDNKKDDDKDDNMQDEALVTKFQETHAAIEAPIYEDSSFVDLDKLIDELAVETSAAAQATSTIEPEQEQNEISSLSVFEAELRASDLKQDLEQDINIFEDEIAHVLPQDDQTQEIENHVADEDAEIIGSYDSGGVTYTLFADGGVLAEAGDISERYHSLEALKAALEDGSSAFKA